MAPATSRCVAHAHHFLSRLDRLETREVDTALKLYRDPTLLRAVMAAAKVPEMCPRVAISLDDPREGPYIVVTRDGYFVTCLGKGMQATDLPIITRGQLDALAEKMEDLRERLALAVHFGATPERPFNTLLRRVLEKADRVSREEFLAVSVWEPMLRTHLVELFLIASKEILELTPALCRIRHFHGKHGETTLHGYWNLVHSAGHLALLATMGGDGAHFQELSAEVPGSRSAIAWALTQTSMAPFIVRGAWAVGRLGKRLLPAYKRALGEDVAYYELLDTIYGLVAIGRRNSGLRAEIVKALRSAPTAARNPQAEQLRRSMAREITAVCQDACYLIECENNALEALLQNIGKRMIGVDELGLPPDAIENLVRVLPSHAYSDGLSDENSFRCAARVVAATARDAPDRFYLPKVFIDRCVINWEPKLSLHLLGPRKRHQRLSQPPIRNENVTGRNEPCPCGSGKKYKRCCGAA